MDRRRHPTTILRWMVDAAIVVLVGLVLLGVGLGRVVPLTGRQTLIIAGPSMEPSIPMGSAAVVEPFGAAGPEVGDVVTIRLGPTTSFVTHRVVRLLTLSGAPYLEMKGDANPTPDPATVPAASVVGRVAWSLPFAGYLLALLSVPVGIAFVLALGMTLVLAAWLLDTFERMPALPVTTADGRPATATGPALEGRVARHLASRPPRARRRPSS